MNAEVTVARAVRSLGPAAATPAILGWLAELLRHPDKDVRGVAAESLGSLGPAAAPEILGRLAQLLCDPESGAVDAVRKLGPAAATPEVLGRLCELLGHPDSNLRDHVFRALRELSPTAPAFLGRLCELLSDPDNDVRWFAARAVSELRSLAIEPPLFKAAAELLDSEASLDSNNKKAIETLVRRGVRFRRHNGQLVPELVADLSRCKEC